MSELVESPHKLYSYPRESLNVPRDCSLKVSSIIRHCSIVTALILLLSCARLFFWQSGNSSRVRSTNRRRIGAALDPYSVNTGMCHTRDLTDQQWKILDPLIPEPARRSDGRGRPWKERRAVLNGILWVLRTGAPWAELPNGYPSYQTCHRRFQQWVRSGTMRGVLEALAADLRVRGVLNVDEAFIEGSFAPAKKGAPRLGKQNEVRDRKSWL